MNSHNRQKLRNEAKSVARVDKHLYHRARMELNAQLPRDFPESVRLQKITASKTLQKEIPKRKASSPKPSVLKRLSSAVTVTRATVSAEHVDKLGNSSLESLPAEISGVFHNKSLISPLKISPVRPTVRPSLSQIQVQTLPTIPKTTKSTSTTY